MDGTLPGCPPRPWLRATTFVPKDKASDEVIAPSGYLTRLAEDIERTVLARAVALHLADRTLVHENKTIRF